MQLSASSQGAELQLGVRCQQLPLSFLGTTVYLLGTGYSDAIETVFAIRSNKIIRKDRMRVNLAKTNSTLLFKTQTRFLWGFLTCVPCATNLGWS